ncbi:MAG: hypothetical protein FD166_2114 [Bacteroidetes bacterium]|nr:MAG: hypothetical protein FD166_2114 [Bacteroidota bacterium]
MTPLFKKLNYKNQPEIIVLNPPATFLTEMDAMKSYARFPVFPGTGTRIEFLMAFVMTQAEVDRLSAAMVPLLAEDAVLWFAYPKQTSKKFRCEFNRDNGWKVLQSLEYEGVRMVAVDEDWSALRFRKQALIRKSR